MGRFRNKSISTTDTSSSVKLDVRNLLSEGDKQLHVKDSKEIKSSRKKSISARSKSVSKENSFVFSAENEFKPRRIGTNDRILRERTNKNGTTETMQSTPQKKWKTDIPLASGNRKRISQKENIVSQNNNVTCKKKPVYLNAQNLPNISKTPKTPYATRNKSAQYEFEVDSEEEKNYPKKKKRSKPAVKKMRSKIMRESFVGLKNVNVDRTSPVKTRCKVKNVKRQNHKEDTHLKKARVLNPLDVLCSDSKETNPERGRPSADSIPEVSLITVGKTIQAHGCQNSVSEVIVSTQPKSPSSRTEYSTPLKENIGDSTPNHQFKVPVLSTWVSEKRCEKNNSADTIQKHCSTPVSSDIDTNQCISTPSMYFSKNLQNHSTPLEKSTKSGSSVGMTSASECNTENCFGFSENDQSSPHVHDEIEQNHSEAFLSPVKRPSDIDRGCEIEVSHHSEISPSICKAAPSRFSLGRVMKNIKPTDFVDRREKTTTVVSQLRPPGPLSPDAKFSNPPRRSYSREHVKRKKRKICEPEFDSEEEDTTSSDKKKTKRKGKKGDNNFDKQLEEWASTLNSELSMIEDFELCVE